jgi:phosphogluconate dehydratase
LSGDQLSWQPCQTKSLDTEVLAAADSPFDQEGGLRLLTGNLGRGVIKVSAVKPELRQVRAQAVVIDDQHALQEKFDTGTLDRDCIVVVRFQGPRANGMPELHKLTPILGVLQDRGHRVALVTDGRMSGASGKVPAAIHMTPEASLGGPLAKVRDGDWIELDAVAGTVQVEVSEEVMANRDAALDNGAGNLGVGREFFAVFRQATGSAEAGASVFFDEPVNASGDLPKSSASAAQQAVV